MKCENCDVEYRVQSDGSEFARNVCVCETKKKCFGKKGKCPNPVVQALLDSEGVEVLQLTCEDHGNAFLIDNEPPPVTEDKGPKVPALPKDPESRAGMVVEEHLYVLTKQQVLEDIKTHTHRVECTNCKNKHEYSKRKLIGKGSNWMIVCPKCEHTGYLILG